MRFTILKKPTLTIALVVLFIVAMVLMRGLFLQSEPEVMQGEVETTDVRISGKIPARVARLYVAEGDRVKRGDTLVCLSAPEWEARLLQADAAYDAAIEQQHKVEGGTRQEQVQMALHQWQQARAKSQITEKTLGRMQRLFDSGVIPEQKLDECRATHEAAFAAEQAAKAAYDMALNGAEQEDREAIRANARLRRGAVDEVEAYMSETWMLAPADGRVAEIFPEQGELLGTGAPIMNIDTDDAWFTFYVREDMLKKYRVGETFDVFVPALDKKMASRVTLMKNVGNFAAWKATRALDRLDLKMFEMQLRPVESGEELQPGMSAVIYK